MTWAFPIFLVLVLVLVLVIVIESRFVSQSD